MIPSTKEKTFGKFHIASISPEEVGKTLAPMLDSCMEEAIRLHAEGVDLKKLNHQHNVRAARKYYLRKAINALENLLI
jgi:hypothetical protein